MRSSSRRVSVHELPQVLHTPPSRLLAVFVVCPAPPTPSPLHRGSSCRGWCHLADCVAAVVCCCLCVDRDHAFEDSPRESAGIQDSAGKCWNSQVPNILTETTQYRRQVLCRHSIHHHPNQYFLLPNPSMAYMTPPPPQLPQIRLCLSAKPPSTQPTSIRQDPLYGREQTLKLCVFHCTIAYVAQDEAPRFSDFCCPRPCAVPQGLFSDHSGIIGSPTICIGLHAHLKLEGHLQ